MIEQNFDPENIRRLAQFRNDELCKKEEAYTIDWIRKNKCPCVRQLRQGMALNCPHLKRAMEEAFHDDLKRIISLTNIALVAELNNNPELCNDVLQGGCSCHKKTEEQ